VENLQIKNSMGHYYVVSDYLASDNEEYLVKMITDNNLKWHLPCKVSYEGCKKVLMYDITNMISLEKEYENKYLEFDELKEVFESINYAYSVGNNYLLEEQYYVLKPDYIFKDMESNEIKMLYLPGYVHGEENRYYPLADFLLQRVNRKCDNCIQSTYQFYRMTKAETFSISMFLNIIDKEQIINKQPEILFEDSIQPEEVQETEEGKERVSYVIPMTLTGITVLGVILYLCLLKRTYYGVYCLSVVIMVSIVTLMLWIKELVMMVKARKEEIASVSDDSLIEKFWEDEDTVVIDDNISDDNDKASEGIMRLEWKEQDGIKKYAISSFPVIIGKMNEEVDCRIDDISISRLHAKMIRKNNRIFIFDLNSTNGTSVNGRKLKPGEETMIMASSEILLGNVMVRLAY